MSEFSADRLIQACSDEGFDAGVTIKTALEPLAGPGATVKPASYLGGKFQVDRRWLGEMDARRAADVVVIDNVPSQANRLEAALERWQQHLGLPMLVLDLSALG